MKKTALLILIAGLFSFVNAQMYGEGEGEHYGDSLEIATVTGYVIVGSEDEQPDYYLDVDNDSTADYELDFGPYWYEPDSSNAVRPINGDSVSVTGGLVVSDDDEEELSELIVYQINGEFWRSPNQHFDDDDGDDKDDEESEYPYIKIEPEEAELEIDETIQFTALFVAGEDDEKDTTVVWQIENTSIAEVDSAGLVTALSEGKTYLTATLDSLSATVELEVESRDDDDDNGDFNPDSLEVVNVTGTAIVIDRPHHPKYFLDVDNDLVADYRLNFGPFWYEPDSSNASRPADGETITIEGGLHESYDDDMNTIVVYEINGEFWRDPYYAFWNDLDDRFDNGRRHRGNHNGYAFGWRRDSISTVELNGIALVDTTLVMDHFYLDTNNDTIPEYFLNFGPWWFEPESGAVRPENGDSVQIVGGQIGGYNLNMVVVYEINGLEWRDSTYFHGNAGGRWIHGNMNNSVKTRNPYDNGDYMEVTPGWKQHGNGNNSDSLFCQILELYPGNVPYSENQNLFMGFEVGIFNSDGSNNMRNNGRMGGKMKFNNRANFQFRYNDIQLKGNNIDENSIMAKYWDDQSNNWVTVSGASIDFESNSISFTSSEISNYVIFTADQVTSVENEIDTKPVIFTLEQNYPNPFNPSTTIEFALNKANRVELNIYNVLGQKIATLLDKNFESGSYKYNFDASDLASGIYFYELKVGNVNSVKKMNLLK